MAVVSSSSSVVVSSRISDAVMVAVAAAAFAAAAERGSGVLHRGDVGQRRYDVGEPVTSTTVGDTLFACEDDDDVAADVDAIGAIDADVDADDVDGPAVAASYDEIDVDVDDEKDDVLVLLVMKS